MPTGPLIDVNGVTDQGEHDIFLGGPGLAGSPLPVAALSATEQFQPELALADLSGDGFIDLITRIRVGVGPSTYSAAFVWLNPAQDPGVTPILLDDEP